MEWRPIAGFEGRYEVSNHGQVKSLVTNRILRPAPSSNGYLTVNLYDGSVPKRCRSITVHSLVCGAFISARPDGMTVNHIDGNKRNNAIENLEYCTMQENIRHAVANGLTPASHDFPAGSPNRKLTPDAVEFIRHVMSHDPPRGMQACLARSFSVTSNVIRDIVRGCTYWPRSDSNGRPSGCKPDALTN